MTSKLKSRKILTLGEHKYIYLRLDRGLEYKEIASELGVAPQTVSNNFQIIYKKLSNALGMPCSCRSQLAETYGSYIYLKGLDLEKIRKQFEDRVYIPSY